MKQIDDGLILITGANGFVGRHLVETLLQIGIAPKQILSLSNSKESPRKSVKHIWADIEDRSIIRATVGDLQPRSIIHLAAIAHPGTAETNIQKSWSINVLGTLNIAEAIMDLSPECHLVFSSSSEVYGRSANLVPMPISEEAPLRPMSVYGSTKAAADIMLNQLARKGLRTTVFRSFNHTGPGQVTDYVVPAFAHQVAEIMDGLRQPTLSVGNLDSVRDFLDVRDVVHAYALAATLPFSRQRPTSLNLCSGIGRTIQSVVHDLSLLAGFEIKILMDPVRQRPSEVPELIGNNIAIQQAFGWSPQFEFNQTLVDVLESFRKKAI